MEILLKYSRVLMLDTAVMSPSVGLYGVYCENLHVIELSAEYAADVVGEISVRRGVSHTATKL
jgi:hypothetical protein